MFILVQCVSNMYVPDYIDKIRDQFENVHRNYEILISYTSKKLADCVGNHIYNINKVKYLVRLFLPIRYTYITTRELSDWL